MGFRHAYLCTKDHPFLCVWVFVMHISVRMTIHILFICFFVMHISVQMTIHLLLYGFSSCTFLYEWLSISLCMFFFHAHFCTNDYPFISVWVFVMHIFVLMTIHILFEWVFVMHISVQMTIHIIIVWVLSCTSLFEWISIFLWVFVMNIFARITIHIILVWVFVMHIFVRMTIHIILYVFLSCTYFYKWLSILFLVFVIHFIVQMTIHI